jgi:mRNA interferase YafQ
MYQVATTRQFGKDLKKCRKRGYDIPLLEYVVQTLADTGVVPPQHKPHKLQGRYAECWECHIKPNWLLIWKQDNTSLTLLLLNTGTHSDVF